MRKNVAIFAVFVLAVAPSVFAQVNAGEARLSLNGTISAGYSDVYSNFAGSDHGIIFGGSADMSGYYYNPGFLSFGVEPFYNQSRDDSSSQSITSSSGVNATAHLFGGTHYPASITYSTTFNGSGNYNLPGLANYTTHGNNDNLAVTWGLHPENLPSLNLSFSNGNSNYSLYGANAAGTLHSDTFSATSSYRIAGFSLNGGEQYTALQSLTPEVLTGGPAQNSDSDTNSLFFNVSHKLPWNGSISAAATRLNLSTDFGDTTSSEKYNTNVDTVTGAINFAPRPHLSFGTSAYYTDNLEGTLYNTLLTTGATVPQNEGQQASNDVSMTAYVNYEMPAEHLHLNGFAERQQQTFLGSQFASDSVNGSADYINTLRGGAFSGVLGVTWTEIDTTHESVLGLNSSVQYTHEIRRWTASGGFGYSEGAQTVLIAYTTSGYTYNGSLGRRIGRKSYWGVYASGARSVLTGLPGSANSSQSYTTSLSLPRYSFSASYSESTGNALLTATGLVATPVPLPAINPADILFYNGKSYSLGVGAHPVHGLTLTAIYAKALSNTLSNSISSKNNNENLDILMTYRLRKLSFIAGYSRFAQGFSVTGTPPAMVGAMYLGISRWFDFF